MPEVSSPVVSEQLEINIAFEQPDRHSIDASVLAESLRGLDQLAQRANSIVNRRDVVLSVKILGGFHEGSFDYKAILDFFGGVLPVALQLVETIKQVIEYRVFLRGKPPASQESDLESGGIRVTNGDGEVNIYKNSVVLIGDSYQVPKR